MVLTLALVGFAIFAGFSVAVVLSGFGATRRAERLRQRALVADERARGAAQGRDAATAGDLARAAQACLGDEPDFAGLAEYSQPIFYEQDIRR